MVLWKFRGMRSSARRLRLVEEIAFFKLNEMYLLTYLAWDLETKRVWPTEDEGKTKKRAEHGDCLKSCCPIEIEHESHVILDFIVATFGIK